MLVMWSQYLKHSSEPTQTQELDQSETDNTYMYNHTAKLALIALRPDFFYYLDYGSADPKSDQMYTKKKLTFFHLPPER